MSIITNTICGILAAICILISSMYEPNHISSDTHLDIIEKELGCDSSSVYESQKKVFTIDLLNTQKTNYANYSKFRCDDGEAENFA